MDDGVLERGIEVDVRSENNHESKLAPVVRCTTPYPMVYSELL